MQGKHERTDKDLPGKIQNVVTFHTNNSLTCQGCKEIIGMDSQRSPSATGPNTAPMKTITIQIKNRGAEEKERKKDEREREIE